MIIKGVVDGFSFVAKIIEGNELPLFIRVQDAVGEVVAKLDLERISEEVLDQISDMIAGG